MKHWGFNLLFKLYAYGKVLSISKHKSMPSTRSHKIITTDSLTSISANTRD